MPAVNSGKVLVTGANGYIAVWVVKAFLDQGFAVRGTVRAESKAAHLRSLFKGFGDKFEVVVVEDITKVSSHLAIGYMHAYMSHFLVSRKWVYAWGNACKSLATS